jgi:ribosome-binding factor A
MKSNPNRKVEEAIQQKNGFRRRRFMKNMYIHMWSKLKNHFDDLPADSLECQIVINLGILVSIPAKTYTPLS